MQVNLAIHCCQIQVYQLLEAKFTGCPWPIPPSAILLHLPVQEIVGTATREEVLRNIISGDRKWRHTTRWQFQDVRPYPKAV